MTIPVGVKKTLCSHFISLSACPHCAPLIETQRQTPVIDQVFRPDLSGDGTLPDIAGEVTPTQSDFERALFLWDMRMPAYEDLLVASVSPTVMPLYSPIARGFWRWVSASRVYRQRRPNKTLNDRQWWDIRDAFTDAVHADAIDLVDKLFFREFSLSQWLVQFADLLKRVHCAAWLLGCGGWNALQSSHLVTIANALRVQFDFLRSLAQEILDRGLDATSRQVGFVTYRGLVNRGVMFIESLTATGERARATTYGIIAEQLPNYPADGTTQCLMRCRCHWRFVTPRGAGDSYFHAYWRLRGGRPDGRNCITCLQYAAAYNPYTVVRF